MARTSTLQHLRAEQAGGKDVHQLLICCSRHQAATVHAAQTLSDCLQKVLSGHIHFDPYAVGRFGSRGNTAKNPGRTSFRGLDHFRDGGLGGLGGGLRFSRYHRSLADGLSRRDRKLMETLSKRLRAGVARSKAVLLLQTEKAYTAPLTLLELYFAAREAKPIICLRLVGSEYEFKEVGLYLQELEANLYNDEPACAVLLAAWLEAHLITFEHLAKTLAEYIPAIIALPVPFSVNGSANQVAATLSDIARLLTDVTKTPSSRKVMGIGGFSKLGGRTKPAKCEATKRVSKREAALRIGSHWRMKQANRAFRQLQHAAIMVESVWRGHVARKHVVNVRQLRDATMIICFHLRQWVQRRRTLCLSVMVESVWRGHVARKHVIYLRQLRDATMIICFHLRQWVRRRRALCLPPPREPTISGGPPTMTRLLVKQVSRLWRVARLMDNHQNTSP